jgi:hypothetical protein
MHARARLAATLSALALAACGSSSHPSTAGTAGFGGSSLCGDAAMLMPQVHVGPDVDLRVVCDGTAQAPVASVDEMSTGSTVWTVSVAGDAQFSVPETELVSCQFKGPAVAFVSFQAPQSALPGDSFSTVATIHAEHGEFPDGTVHVRAEIVPASATTATPTIDFGDVPTGRIAHAPDLVIVLADGTNLTVDEAPALPFALMPEGPSKVGARNIRAWQATFAVNEPGDYTTTASWTAAPAGTPMTPPDACTTRLMVTMHARAVAPDASAGDGATDDGDTGATDDAAPGPLLDIGAEGP